MSLSSVPSDVSAKSPLVVDVSLTNFKVEVLDASRKQLVIVDFWAPWCAPCKQLGPQMEAAVLAYKGAVKLAKIDVDSNQSIAQQMGVQSIPAVFAFFNGQTVDGFMGIVSEPQLKAWLDRLVKATGAHIEAAAMEEGSVEQLLAQAEQFLAAGDVALAASFYDDVLKKEPAQLKAYTGLLGCLLSLGDVDTVSTMITNAPDAVKKDPVFISQRAAFELAEEAQKAAGSLTELLQRVEKDPKDLAALFDLALAHFAQGDREKAVDCLLESVRLNRAWNEEAARKQLVKFFEAFGPVDPLTIEARKRLSSILFS